MPNDSKPWDQQQGESKEAYARFLIYRNLGPARSIDVAYAAAQSLAAKRVKSRQPAKRASGQWMKDSVNYNWPERAAAWDIEVFSEAGQRVVINFISILEVLSRNTLEALANPRVKPHSLKSIMTLVGILGAYIPAETVAALRDYSGTDRAPAIGNAGLNPPTTINN